MRLHFVLLAISAAVYAGCDAASATTETTLTQAAIAHQALPAHLDSPSNRRLRGVDMATAKTEAIEEERAFERLATLLRPAEKSIPTFVGKVTRKDGTFTKNYVDWLLKKENKAVRRKFFEDNAKWDDEGKQLMASLGNLRTAEEAKLFGKFEKFLDKTG